MGGEPAFAFERVTREGPVPAAPSKRSRFERLLDRHHRRLRRVVAGMLVDRDRIDDVLQEAYLRAYRKLPRRFADEAHEAAWLYTVVYRCSLDELRRARRRPETPQAELHVVAPGRPPDVLEVLRTLQPSDRAVLLLVDLLGFDYEEAAEVLGVPRGTVASRLNAARTRFRRALDA